MKFTQAAQADLCVAAQAQFESLWNDPEFERFEPGNSGTEPQRQNQEDSGSVPNRSVNAHIAPALMDLWTFPDTSSAITRWKFSPSARSRLPG